MEKKKKKVEEIKRVNAKYNRGLSTYQVNKRISMDLVNQTKIKVSATYLKIIVKNVFTFFNILLITIGIILIIFNLWSSTVFLVILLLNTTIGLAQDIRAKRAVDKLNLIEDDNVTVIRDEKEVVISSKDVVLDDIIYLERDSKIPCDSIVIKGEGSVNESLITGESLPAKKTMNSEVLSGTYVTSGAFYVRAMKVGKENYVSKLQMKSKEYKKPNSKMFVQLNKLFKIISIFVIVLGFLELIEFGLISIFTIDFELDDIYEFLRNNVILQLAGSLVSMIPSGMYLLTSTALTVGVLILARKKVLIKDMYSQETLARVDTLCIDKTGTITSGELSVFKYQIINDAMNEDRFKALIASYCTKLGEDNETSKSLLNYFHSSMIFNVQNYIPFDSVNKYSAAEIQDNGTLVIGAYNFFDLENHDEIEEDINKYSLAGFRVIVVGLSPKPIGKNNRLPKNIKAIGLIYLQDHIREEAKESLKWFNDNDVDVKVISGDNPLTVYRIAEAAGVINAKSYISLEGKSDEEVKELASQYTVFGRVKPEQKELIIKSLKENGKTVAMVGDGINDVLSLKTADVSIALESGSKASKDISSLVLLNDDFTKLPDVVYEGRKVINNLQRTCSLFLTKTVFAVFLNVFFLLYGLATAFGDRNAQLWPFATNNFYIWELITIGISSFLLAVEPNIQIVKGNFITNILKRALPNGLIMGLLVSGIYLFNFTDVINFKDYEMLNIATLFISFASFIPLIDVSIPLNKYRRIVVIIGIVLATLIFIWTIYGFNWLFINGPHSLPPRYITVNEIVTIIVMISLYVVLYALYRITANYWDKMNKNVIKLGNNESKE